ncbi:hypothetical protein [Antarcticimicrobium luteum]|nr:hypothetical protein [Antarcticimicrobium luteum]
MSMDAGDWVQFEVTSGCEMRYAHNPRLVAEGVFTGLADNLKGIPASELSGRPPAAKIIRFVAPEPARRGYETSATDRG